MISKTMRGSADGLIMTEKVYQQICDTIGRHPAETGGLLGSSDGVRIDHYYFDVTANCTGGTYTMDYHALNNVIHRWNDVDINVIGFIHSHPFGYNKPSAGDEETASHIIDLLDVGGKLFTPIVQVSPRLDGTIEIYPYTIENTVNVHDQNLKILKSQPSNEAPKQQKGRTAPNRFQRIEGILPTNILAKKAVVCVGCGGSRTFLESLARCGVGTFVLMDGDTVEDTNIATQGAFCSEIGRFKTEAIRDSILNINPTAKVTCINQYLDSTISDSEFMKRIGVIDKPFSDVLLCGCTDNFYAQDRCAQLAVKFLMPYMAAQIYKDGNGHEVIFYYPHVTSSCPRCMLETRYRNVLTSTDPEQSAEGSSADTPVFLTDSLNNVKCMIAMKLLCCGEKDTAYCEDLEQIKDHNYVMTQWRTDFNTPPFQPLFDVEDKESDISIYGSTILLKQTPEANCPLCHGTGLPPQEGIPDTRECPNPYAAAAETAP